MSKLPMAVVRPTMVLGDSRTGEVDHDGAAYLLVLILMTLPPDLPLPARPDAALHLVPVDYYVRAASVIGRDARAPGRTFHVGDPAPLVARRLFELVAAAASAHPLRGFLMATKALLRTPGLERLAKTPRGFLEAMVSRVTYSFSNTAELLADTDVRCPPLESYVDRLVEHVQQGLQNERALDLEVDDPLV
jgi:thioester reductase-like protein